MSKKSDDYEIYIAESIDNIDGYNAERPRCSVKYSDVLINDKYWLEVKMNHSDNLSNPRVYFKDQRWNTTYKTPVAKIAVEWLNDSDQAINFVNKISEYSKIDRSKIEIPTTKSGLSRKYSVPLGTMKEYFQKVTETRYIHKKENINMGNLITQHYIYGKEEPVYYIQAGDDFYKIASYNPLKLKEDIPELQGIGDFKVRVSTRSKFYEIQIEAKIKQLPTSPYSVKFGSTKMNPLIKEIA